MTSRLKNGGFNRGNWLQLENKMATCGSLPNGRIRYDIGANYPNSTALIPNNMTMELRNQSTGSYVLLSFSNVDYGGTNGTTERNRGVTFLTNQGCNQGAVSPCSPARADRACSRRAPSRHDRLGAPVGSAPPRAEPFTDVEPLTTGTRARP